MSMTDKKVFKSEFQAWEWIKEMFPDIESLKENLGSIKDTLIGSMNTALSALNLIDENQYKGVIENILTYGSCKVIDKVLKGYDIAIPLSNPTSVCSPCCISKNASFSVYSIKLHDVNFTT